MAVTARMRAGSPAAEAGDVPIATRPVNRRTAVARVEGGGTRGEPRGGTRKSGGAAGGGAGGGGGGDQRQRGARATRAGPRPGGTERPRPGAGPASRR